MTSQEKVSAAYRRWRKAADRGYGERMTRPSQMEKVDANIRRLKAAYEKAAMEAKVRQNPGIRAQVRRLPSGQVQIKVPLKRGENPLAKAKQLARTLGRKIVSVARMKNGRVCNPSRGTVDTDAARELELYTENDADLYRQQYQPILKNLATKRARGIYKHDLAVKLFMYLMESGAKKYAKEFGGPGANWHEMFNVPTRRAAAERFAKHFEVEYDLGNYDNLLPKKYQKKANPSVGWNVYLRGKWIDKVFYDTSYRSADEVKRSLVNHDGYDPAITVRREGKKKANPDKAYWQYPWTVVVGPGTRMADVYSRGFNTEKPARAYAKQIKKRVYSTGVDVKILHNTGTNAPGGVKEYVA